MGLWEALGKIQPPRQTVSDDGRSRVARRQQAEQARMTRVEYDEKTGKPQLWYTINITSIAGYSSIPVSWLGTSEEDARDSFVEWLALNEFQTVDFTNDGKDVRFTFRGAWVAGFTMDGKGRARP